MRFLRGLLAPFRGAVFVLRRGLLHLVILPAAINVLLATGAGVASYRFVSHHERVRDLAGDHGIVATLLTTVIALVSAGILFLAAQPILGGIFNDRLSERVEALERGAVPSVSTLAAARDALAHSVVKVALYATTALAGLLLLPVFGLGSAVFVVLGAASLAYDNFDYPLARRGAGFGEKLRYLRAHPALVAGFAIGAAALFLVPLAFLFAPSFLAAGATLVFLDDDERAAPGRPRLD